MIKEINVFDCDFLFYKDVLYKNVLCCLNFFMFNLIYVLEKIVIYLLDFI